LWWGILAAALVLPVALWLRGDRVTDPSRLEDYGSVPDFELTEQNGRTVRRADLAGSPWLANFVFTRCEGTCPILSSRMAELQGALGPDVRLVSFSVDPDHDTPDVLAEYSGRFGARPDRWLFLTGPVAEVRSLIRDGFHLSVVAAEGHGAITHSDRIALVDGDLRIRRYYLGTEKGWIAEALRDLEALR
jgi:protein SCO1